MRPPIRRPRSDRGLWPFVALFLLLLACAALAMVYFVRHSNDQSREAAGPPQPRNDALPPPAVEWSKVGDSHSEGDVRIEMSDATTDLVTGVQGLDARNFFRLKVKVRVENVSKTRVLRWRQWQGEGTVQDEHGNAFKPQGLGDWGAYEPLDYTRAIDPGAAHVFYLLFEPPPAVSREVRLSLPASTFAPDSAATLRFRLPLTHLRRPVQ